jgi:hypothetical protein
MRCEEGGDTKTHLSEMLRIRESLAGMGATIDDKDFYAIILGSLPESYRPLLSSINATARINKKILIPDELINLITEEYEHRLLTDSKAEKRGGSALSANESGHRRKRGSANNAHQNNQETVCYNCNWKGHYKQDCWRPGGGKEGQGPNQKRNQGGNI